jgi:hypothetical protein
MRELITGAGSWLVLRLCAEGGTASARGTLDCVDRTGSLAVSGDGRLRCLGLTNAACLDRASTAGFPSQSARIAVNRLTC